jgi:pyruvate decarboxylase
LVSIHFDVSYFLDLNLRLASIQVWQYLVIKMTEHIDLAEFLFARLKQLGAASIHGVPGDYNLTALDYIAPAGITWVGNANELNSGYAADGYARIKGLGALITAFGVGELSAINAIGGAYAELAPVVHIVGTPPTTAQEKGVNLHHSLGDGNFRVFAEMAAKVTVAQTNLTDPSTATAEIDRCLRECILQSRPVYIELPTNMVKARVLKSALDKSVDLSLPQSDEGFEDAEVELILERIYASKQPFIMVDGLTSRYGISEEADELVRVTGFPTSTTPFGKGTVNETYSNFHGVYAGVAGREVYMPWFQACDLVLRLGPLGSDVNTFGFTTIPDPKVTITFNRDSVDIGGSSRSEQYRNLHVKSLLRKILDRLDQSRLPKYDPYPDLGDPAAHLKALAPAQRDAIIDQDTFWLRISEFFRSGDIILTETGTPSVGGRDMILPPHTNLINSSLWLSIGYMLPAAQGAALALRELTSEGKRMAGRTVLIEGDGSLQMTAQSFSDMIRNRLDLIIFVINNDGYTIERWIHGMKAHYNDIQPWRYLEAPSYFGAPKDDPNYPVMTKRASTWGELNDILADRSFAAGKGLQIVEVMMTQEDAPDALKKLVKTAARRNSGEDVKKVDNVTKKVEEKVMKVAG